MHMDMAYGIWHMAYVRYPCRVWVYGATIAPGSPRKPLVRFAALAYIQARLGPA
jgi:hypothetical protein